MAVRSGIDIKGFPMLSIQTIFVFDWKAASNCTKSSAGANVTVIPARLQIL
jgi:hypothetical protein